MTGTGFLRAMPFLGLAVLLYVGGVSLAGVPLAREILGFSLPSGARLGLTFGDLIIAVGLVLFFVELLLSTKPTQTSLINHGLSMALFVGCILLFLLYADCGTSTFFLLTMLTLIDVISGYSISIITARRDVSFERDA